MPRVPGGRAELYRRRARARQIRRRRAVALVALLGIVVIVGVLIARAGAPDTESAPVAANPTAPAVSGDPGEIESFTVSGSGDILIHSPVWADAASGNGYDFTPMFDPIRRWVRGVDLALCHVETPITTAPPSGYPIFSAPADLATSIADTGWEACDTASNHSLDQGQEGIDQTGELLDRAGVKHTGSAESRAAADRPVVLPAGPAKIGFLAYTDATNGIPSPHPWSVNVLPAADPVGPKAERVSRDVKRTLDAGADTVMIAMQWGDENSQTPNPSQRALARRMLAIDGVAAISGQGPHVVQPIERIGDKFVVFSEGNLLSNQGTYTGLPAATQDGLIALFRFAGSDGKYEVKRVDYVPVMVNPVGHVVLPTGSGAKSNPDLAGSLADSWQRTVDVAGRGSGIRPIPNRRPGS